MGLWHDLCAQSDGLIKGFNADSLSGIRKEARGTDPLHLGVARHERAQPLARLRFLAQRCGTVLEGGLAGSGVSVEF